jgi:ATP-binding cassette, subfamily B, bacterial
MSKILRHASARIRKLSGQFRHLPRTLAIVLDASGWLTAIWAVLLAIQGLLPVATVYLTRAIVNGLVLAIRSGGEWSTTRPVLVLAAWIGVVLFANLLAHTATAWVRTAQSEMVKDHIAGLIQKKSLEVDLEFYDSPDSYDHLHRARMEATHRPIELVEGLGSLLQGSLTAIALFFVLLPSGPVLPCALVLSTTPILYALLKVAYHRHRWDQESTIDQRRSWYYDSLITEAENASEIRLFNLGDRFSQAFQALRRRLRKDRLRLAAEENVSGLWAGSLSLFVLGGALAWKSWQAIQGELSLGELALCYQAFLQVLDVSRSLLENLGKFYENSLFLGNLFEFLDFQPQLVAPSPGRALRSPMCSGIRFQDVSFSYPGSTQKILQAFSLEVRPGDTIAIVGPNGSGKSTLVKLLCRFYDPQEGSISIDGIPLPELSPSALRSAVTAIFQQPIRFNDTVANNIKFGTLDIAELQTADAMATVAERAGLTQTIAGLPAGYETQLGRAYLDGTELSVGEWQRLALARATIRPAPILILDEPTSAMDPWAELKWAQGLRNHPSDRITVLITHRFTTAMFADMIYVVSHGKIVESGSHQTLLALGGYYAQGWAAQSRA